MGRGEQTFSDLLHVGNSLLIIILAPQISRIPFPPPGVHALPTPVTAMTFDTCQELLWTGNDYVCFPLPRAAPLWPSS